MTWMPRSTVAPRTYAADGPKPSQRISVRALGSYFCSLVAKDYYAIEVCRVGFERLAVS
jgi:hypothetical protein